MEPKPTLDKMASIDFDQFIDEYVAAMSILVVLVAIPPNAWTLYKVIRWRRFHLNRNVIWLGTGVTNIFHVLCHLTEVGALYFSSATARAILPYLSWVPEVYFLIQYIFSMIHRYLCTRRADFYRRHVTVKRIVASQVTVFTIAFLLIKGKFFFGSFTPSYYKEIVNTTLVGLLTVSTVTIFLLAYPLQPKNVRNVEDNPTVHYRRSFPNSSRPADNLPDEVPEPDVVNTTEGSPVDDVTISQLPSAFVMVNNQRVSRLDLDAVRNSTISEMVSLVFGIPSITCYFFLDRCLQGDSLNGSDRHHNSCRLHGLAFFYSRLFFIFAHCMFNPLFFARHRRDKIGTPSQ